nr:hypothetical protein [Tanacetum cinerariifolium]
MAACITNSSQSQSQFQSIDMLSRLHRFGLCVILIMCQTSLHADLQIAADANEPIPSPVEDADLIASHPNTFFNPALLNWNWDDVIVIPSYDDEANVKEPIPLPVEDADVEIDDQILFAFMELDPIFNPADVDFDVEVFDDQSPICFNRSTKKSMSSLSKCKKLTIIDVSTDEEFEKR